jgi:hypothetical protein
VLLNGADGIPTPGGRAVEAKGPCGAPGGLAGSVMVFGGDVGSGNGGWPLTPPLGPPSGGSARTEQRIPRVDSIVINFMVAEKNRSFEGIIK